MRNLKKLLALVLAMVMAFSLMLSVSAADVKYDDYKDKDKVTPEFVESVSVLTGLKVVQGDGEEGNKSFRPQDDITRAEAAAMVYRLATGDVDDRQVKLYSDYGKFSDVKSDDWFAGYVGYCQNAGIIKGTTPTTFSPYLKVTGYEVLAMILRAVGYGKNNEFTGPSWQVNVASMGKTKHITDSVSSAQYNYTLNMNARREIVAELMFRGSLIPQVTWTQIGGYNENSTLLGTGGRNLYLSEEVFGLYPDGWKADAWGRPQYVWKANLNPSTDRTVATLKANYTEAFHDEKRECDVAELMEFGTDAARDYILYVNGKTAVTDKYHIVATDTVTRVGGYGRQVEIYTREDMDKQFPWHNTLNYANNLKDEYWRLAPEDTIVMVDTYLAKVVNKTEPVLDPAGHVITPAKLIVDLYDANNSVPFDKAASANVPNRRTIQKGATSKDSWDFAIGDVISLNGLSSNTAVGASGDERWAYTLPQVAVPSNGILTEKAQVFDLTKLDGTQAKQTTVYWNNGKHQVGGEDKTDALALRMDKAGTNIDTTYTWYYDQYGYLLGIDDGGKVNYGVITSVYASYGTNDAASTDGVAKAVATVKYADGTTGTETIDYFMVTGTGAGTRGTITTAMTDSAQSVQLWPVYNIGSLLPMQETAWNFYGGTLSVPNPVHGVAQGMVNMAPVAASNNQAYIAGQGTTGGATDVNVHGILNDNLFKFVKSAGDKTVAIEVAGGGTTYTDASDNYEGATAIAANTNYAGHWAAANTDGKLYKNLAYITTASGAASNANVVAWLDNETQIMVRSEDNGSIACYDGVSALPGDVTISQTADAATHRRYMEIDWADTDGDGRAEYVYLTGRIEGVTTYGLFYTNDQSAQWNGTTATISGFLNGEQTTLTFNSLAEFNKIKDNSYAGHLYAVKKVGDVVTNVMVTDWTGDTVKLVPTDGSIVKTFGVGTKSSGAGITVDAGATDDFKYGTEAGYIGTNPYTDTTEAVYFRDYRTPADNQWRLTYNPSYNWSQLGADVIAEQYDSASNTYDETRRFHLTPNTKVYGLGSNVVLAEGATALEYLNHSNINWNDVTIVYENAYGAGTATAVFSVLELYIQTDPNWTPTQTPGVSAATAPTGGAVRSGGATANSLATAIENGAPNTVVYGTDKTTTDGTLAGGSKELALFKTAMGLNLGASDGNNLSQYLFFPYNVSATTAITATLTITEADGTFVYSENASVVDGGTLSTAPFGGAAGQHVFTVNFAGTANNAMGTPSGRLTMKAGTTYNFSITTVSLSGLVTLSSGSFTMV